MTITDEEAEVFILAKLGDFGLSEFEMGMESFLESGKMREREKERESRC